MSETEYNIISCTREEADSHLRAFIAAFIVPQAQPRWREFLLDRRTEWEVTPPTPRSRKITQKADEVMRHFAADPRFCTRVPTAQRTPLLLEVAFGKTPGVYFALRTPPCRLTPVEAEANFAWENNCALLSFQAGKKALFFCHDGGVWKCEKTG